MGGRDQVKRNKNGANKRLAAAKAVIGTRNEDILKWKYRSRFGDVLHHSLLDFLYAGNE